MALTSQDLGSLRTDFIRLLYFLEKRFTPSKLPRGQESAASLWLRQETGRMELTGKLENGHFQAVPLLFHAAAADCLHITKYMLRACPGLLYERCHGRTLLHFAAFEGAVKVMDELLHCGLGVDVWDGDERTPLSWAAEGVSIEAARLLLVWEADINAYDMRCCTPLAALSLAGFYGEPDTDERRKHEELEIFFKDQGAIFRSDPPNTSELPEVEGALRSWVIARSRDDAGWTKLHHACKSPFGLINAYIDHGADVNAQTIDGDTPLHIAIKHNNHDTVLELRAYNADLSIPNSNGFLPWQLCPYDGHWKEQLQEATERQLKSLSNHEPQRF